jgi:small conductance mechanosensitive channel
MWSSKSVLVLDLEIIKKIINDTLGNFKDKFPESKISIGVSKIEADGYTVLLNLMVNAEGFLDTKLTFQEAIIRNLRNAGVKLPGM